MYHPRTLIREQDGVTCEHPAMRELYIRGKDNVVIRDMPYLLSKALKELENRYI